jgi:CheY-like chemotaxis protein
MPRSILIVEDDRPTQALLVALTNRCGYVATSAFDGGAALRHIHDDQPDGMILDLLLPVMSGLEILGELAVMNSDLICRTVVVTAAAESFYRDRPEIAACRAVLRKPFDIDELEHAMLSLFDGSDGDGGKKVRAGGTMRLKIV